MASSPKVSGYYKAISNCRFCLYNRWERFPFYEWTASRSQWRNDGSRIAGHNQVNNLFGVMVCIFQHVKAGQRDLFQLDWYIWTDHLAYIIRSGDTIPRSSGESLKHSFCSYGETRTNL